MKYIDKDLGELRRWLERQLRIEYLPESIWTKLCEGRYAEEGLDERDRRDLIDAARDYLDVYRAGARQTTATKGQGRASPTFPEGGSTIEVELGEYELQRKRAATKVLARNIELNEDAKGNKVIADFRARWLKDGLLVPGQAREFLSTPSEALDALHRLASRWATFYAWEEEDMAWTILTGEAPQLGPLNVKVLYHGLRPIRIVITAEHWLPAEVVERNFKQAQRRLLGGDKRRPSARSLGVLEFVEDQIRSDGERPSWRELLKRWNARFPEWAYEDAANFHRVYHRALHKVAHPTVWLIGSRASPAEQRRRKRQHEDAEAAKARIIELFGRPGARFVPAAPKD